MAENIPNILNRLIFRQLQDAEQTLRRKITTKKCISWYYVIIKLQEANIKTLKTARAKYTLYIAIIEQLFRKSVRI